MKRVGENLGIGLRPEDDSKLAQLAAQIRMIVDLAIEGDRDAPVGRQLRLDCVFGIDNPQPARPHRRILAEHHDRVGDVAAMQNALNELLNRELSFGPADRDCNSAH